MKRARTLVFVSSAEDMMEVTFPGTFRLHVLDYLCSTLLLRCFSDCARCGKFGVPLYWAFVFRCVLASLWQGFGPLFEGFVVRVHREVFA